jgi:hypothetical protein
MGVDPAPRRRDEFTEWHDLLEATCAECGCVIFVAADDPEIVWEPGQAWSEGCRDRRCHCHVDALDGARRE